MEKKGEKRWSPLPSFEVPEKQKKRWPGIALLSLLLAAVLIGVAWWFTRSPAEPNPEKAKPIDRADVAKKAETPPPIAEKPNEEESPSSRENAVSGADTTGAAMEPPSISPAWPAADERKRSAPASENSAQQFFDAGNFDAAGEVWRKEIVSQQIRFSILIEMDCLKESVFDAYHQVEDKKELFLLNKTARDGRNCWLVLWGRYRTADEAARAMNLLPEYFLKQTDPPSVVELEPYL